MVLTLLVCLGTLVEHGVGAGEVVWHATRLHECLLGSEVGAVEGFLVIEVSICALRHTHKTSKFRLPLNLQMITSNRLLYLIRIMRGWNLLRRNVHRATIRSRVKLNNGYPPGHHWLLFRGWLRRFGWQLRFWGRLHGHGFSLNFNLGLLDQSRAALALCGMASQAIQRALEVPQMLFLTLAHTLSSTLADVILISRVRIELLWVVFSPRMLQEALVHNLPILESLGVQRLSEEWRRVSLLHLLINLKLRLALSAWLVTNLVEQLFLLSLLIQKLRKRSITG